MVEKSRVVKRIKIPVSSLKKKKSAERLETFWNIVIETLKTKNRELKVDVSKVFVGKELSDLLMKGASPYDWLDIGPVVDDDIPQHKEEFLVEIRAGFNLLRRKRSDCEKVRRMLIGE